MSTRRGGEIRRTNHDRSFSSVRNVEISQLLKGVGASDVGVEDKEGSVVLAEDVLGEGEGSGWRGAKRSDAEGSRSRREGRTGSERLRLDGEGDLDAVLGFALGEERDHDFGTVVYRENDVLDSRLRFATD